MSTVIGPVELQILADASGFKASLERQLAPGLTSMNRQVAGAVATATKDFDKIGVGASKSLDKIGQSKALKNLGADLAKVATTAAKSFDGLGDKIDDELTVDGRALTRSTTAAAAAAAKAVPAEFAKVTPDIARRLTITGQGGLFREVLADAKEVARLTPGEFSRVDDAIARQLETSGQGGVFAGLLDDAADTARRLPDEFSRVEEQIADQIGGRDTDTFRGVLSDASQAAQRLPGEFSDVGRRIGSEIQQGVNLADIRADVAADVAVDTSAVARDVSAALGTAQVPIGVDAADLSAQVDRGVNAQTYILDIDVARLTAQVSRAVNQADQVGVNVDRLAEQITAAIQDALAGIELDASVSGGGSASTFNPSSIVASTASSTVAQSVAERLTPENDTINIDLDEEAIAESIKAEIELTDVNLKIDRPAIASQIEEAVAVVELKPKVDGPAVAAEIAKAVEATPVAYPVKTPPYPVKTPPPPRSGARSLADDPDSILGATDRATITIIPDYTAVAAKLEREANKPHVITIVPDYTAVAADIDRAVNQADIILPAPDTANVTRSILGAVEQADIQITPGFASLARDMQRAVDRADIRLNIDNDVLGRDIRRIIDSTDIKIGVGVETKELTAAERAYDAFAKKLREGSEVEFDVDDTQIRQAFDLAERLADLVVDIDVDTDLEQLQQAQEIAQALDGFAAQIDLRTGGAGELREALGAADALERIATVAIAVKGEEDLKRALNLAEDLEKKRTVPIDARAEDLIKLQDSLGAAGEGGGIEAAAGFAESFGTSGDIANAGSFALDQLTGVIGAAGPWGVAAAGVAAVFGDEFIAGFTEQWNQQATDTVRQLSAGISDAQMERVGIAGGKVYAAGFGEGLADVKDAAALIESELGDIDRALDLTEATRQAKALEEVFGIDLATSVATVDKLIQNGIVRNSRDGFNLLAELGNRTGLQFEETLEVATEFSNALKAIGIDGPQGMYLIGESIERGIYPQVDQAGEVFEEFNEELRNGGSVEALDRIGLSGKEMQDKLADGRGAEAMAEISRVLLGMEDTTARNAAAAEIFGGNMGLLGTEATTAALELYATADATREVGDAASANADILEENRTAFQKLGYWAEYAGGALARITDDFLSNGTIGAAASIKDELLGIGDSLLGLDGPSKSGADSLSKIEKGADDTATALDDTTTSIDDLLGKLDALKGDFTADELFRDVLEARDDLVGLFEDAGAASVGFGGDIDVSSEAGRRLQEQMERLRDKVLLATEAYATGEIDVGEYNRITGEAERALADTAAQAGVTGDKIDGLNDKYLNLPDDVEADVRAIDNVTEPVGFMQRVINTLQGKTVPVGADTTAGLTNVGFLQKAIDQVKGKTVTVEVKELVRGGGSLGKYALGGIADEPAIFGEDGRELALPLTKPGRMDTLLRAHATDIAASMGGVDRMFDAITAGLSVPAPPEIVDAGSTATAIYATSPPPAPAPVTQRAGNTHYHSWYLNEPNDLHRELALIDQLV